MEGRVGAPAQGPFPRDNRDNRAWEKGVFRVCETILFLSQAMSEPGLARARPWVELWEGLGCPWESFRRIFRIQNSPCGHLLGDTELKNIISVIFGYKNCGAYAWRYIIFRDVFGNEKDT